MVGAVQVKDANIVTVIKISKTKHSVPAFDLNQISRQWDGLIQIAFTALMLIIVDIRDSVGAFIHIVIGPGHGEDGFFTLAVFRKATVLNDEFKCRMLTVQPAEAVLGIVDLICADLIAFRIAVFEGKATLPFFDLDHRIRHSRCIPPLARSGADLQAHFAPVPGP